MAVEWFYFRGEERLGPFTAQQLKDFADRGTVRPDSLIWKEGLEKPVPATKLKGLFAAPSSEAVESETPSVPYDPSVLPAGLNTPSPADLLAKYRTEVWFVALTLFCCFPAGLYFVWTHPTYTKRKKWIITGCVAAFFLLISLGQKKKDAGEPEGSLLQKSVERERVTDEEFDGCINTMVKVLGTDRRRTTEFFKQWQRDFNLSSFQLGQLERDIRSIAKDTGRSGDRIFPKLELVRQALMNAGGESSYTASFAKNLINLEFRR